MMVCQAGVHVGWLQVMAISLSRNYPIAEGLNDGDFPSRDNR
jgi:hypothetical protein